MRRKDIKNGQDYAIGDSPKLTTWVRATVVDNDAPMKVWGTWDSHKAAVNGVRVAFPSDGDLPPRRKTVPLGQVRAPWTPEIEAEQNRSEALRAARVAWRAKITDLFNDRVPGALLMGPAFPGAKIVMALEPLAEALNIELPPYPEDP